MASRWGKAAKRWALAFAVAVSGFGGNASALLLNRGPDMVYDNVLDITWTRQAGDGVARSWQDANAWAAALVFGGVDDWRLPYASVAAGAGPTTTVVNCSTATEVACRDNEMGYMFYHDLGGTLGQNKTGNQTAVGGEMLTGIETAYWSGTEFSSSFAWVFGFDAGNQNFLDKRSQFFAWAVRPGDVAAAVPEPASLLLVGLGALGLALSRRRGRRR